MPKINLLYVITKLELGGAQKQLLELVRRLDREKFNPLIFCASQGLLLPEALALEGTGVYKSKFLERPPDPLKDAAAFRELCRFIHQYKIALVHTHSSKAGIIGRFAARSCGIKNIVHTVHGWPFHGYQPFFFRELFLRLEKAAGRFTRRIITVSEYDRQKGIDSGIGSQDKYRVIPYGIDRRPCLKERGEVRKGFGVKEDEFLLGNISCFKPQKGLFDFIRACRLIAAQAPNLRFLLVGDGSLRRPIEEMINRFNLAERFILPGWRRDIPEILSAIDALALTSLWEGLPIAVLEALFAGRPVVSTDTGGIREAVKDGVNGFLVPCGDIGQIAERIIRLFKDAGLRCRMGEAAAVSLARRFDLDGMAEETQRLYSELLDTNHDPLTTHHD